MHIRHDENGIVCLFTLSVNATVDGKRQYRLVRSTIDTVRSNFFEQLEIQLPRLITPHQIQLIELCYLTVGLVASVFLGKESVGIIVALQPNGPLKNLRSRWQALVVQ
jgi:hypothetical protein